MLTVSINDDHFKVFLTDENGVSTDVTERYEVYSVAMEDGRPGWAVSERIDGK